MQDNNKNNLGEEYKKFVEEAFIKAENNISKINQDVLNIDGMTGVKTRHFYNNLLVLEDARYLEIGTWKGSSVCSAMYNNNHAKIVCIDNSSQFGNVLEEMTCNINKFKGSNDNIIFIPNDCFTIDINSLPHKFNIYMYDGDHKEEDQYKALTYYINILDDVFIYVVDDWNVEHIRTGTKKAIDDLKLKVIYDKEVFAGRDGRDGWWNGIYISVLEKTN